MKKMLALAALVGLLPQFANAAANVRITEWMYNGDEFIEFTNMGSTAISFAGWSFDDDSRTAGVVDLSAFGLVGIGESVILAEASAADFRAAWGLDSTLKIIGGNAVNLGRADEINLFDNSNALVDRLTFGDNTISGTIRTQNVSGRPGSLAALGANNVSQWVLSTIGDVEGSYASVPSEFIGNPGSYVLAPVPEPEAYAMLLAGLGLIGLARRRRG